MFHIALHEPRIAPNTGNIIRLTANNGCHLHLIEPLGFDLDEKKVRRAGLDYHDLARVSRHPNYPAFLQHMQGRRIFACTTKGRHRHDQARFVAGDVLLFGSETAGLPPAILESFPEQQKLRLPMLPTSRSMNLSNAVAIVSYEAWRQIGFAGGGITSS
ncbi:tRNA (cytidine(34)-2'-O)-methyltransferase [Kineobactrum salinum]|uniref:tRNA (cytidine(34)-2'-O)-methyltransferase n=1 Tax=Kineobactrum salinum TaxID=2708301 RepID=A0A6C0U102_9GAMM|nr:tRNA (cytidine(34)-2'-O)-methyltransferase [Kineobactrum salinum]QIB65802.1 tRNA (cytidine(34)-2'-O)-methyltransferase [Kineobactrum salinum]